MSRWHGQAAHLLATARPESPDSGLAAVRPQVSRRRVRPARFSRERYMTVPTTSEVERAYAAGIVDGEGCIDAVAQNNRGRVRVRARVTVANTDMALLEWLQERWGGTIYRRDDGTNKPVHSWTVSSLVMVCLLEDLLPHLRVKLTQAEVALELAATMGTGRNGRSGTPASVQEHRLGLLEQLKHLKAGSF